MDYGRLLEKEELLTTGSQVGIFTGIDASGSIAYFNNEGKIVKGVEALVKGIHVGCSDPAKYWMWRQTLNGHNQHGPISLTKPTDCMLALDEYVCNEDTPLYKFMIRQLTFIKQQADYWKRSSTKFRTASVLMTDGHNFIQEHNERFGPRKVRDLEEEDLAKVIELADSLRSDPRHQFFGIGVLSRHLEKMHRDKLIQRSAGNRFINWLTERGWIKEDEPDSIEGKYQTPYHYIFGKMGIPQENIFTAKSTEESIMNAMIQASQSIVRGGAAAERKVGAL